MDALKLTLVAALGVPLLAQITIDQETNRVFGAFTLGTAEHVAMQPRAVQFLAGMGEGALVKGAPYSGEAVTEFVQTLADGTRITRKSISKMARDSEGRTRNETGGAAAGPVGFEVEPIVVINDPVAKSLIYLYEREKRASRVPMMRMEVTRFEAIRTEKGRADRDVVFQRAVPPPPPPPPGSPTAGVAVNYAYTAVLVQPGGKEAERESLGKQVIAGVSCDTTRITDSIPAGQIGNDREIRVFTETCVSPELKITLVSRTVDPMNGETIFRMASLSRAEPSKSLFQVPAGFTVDEAPAPPPTPGIRIRKQ
jgi:hypothetical protein